MITPDGYKYWVQNKEGVPFPEHQVDVKLEGLKTTMTCYLEIEPGVEFQIGYASLHGMKNDRALYFSADGTEICAHSMYQSSGPKQSLVTHKPIGPATSLPLVFSSIETTDDDDSCNRDQGYLMKLGQLECKSYAGTLGTVARGGPRSYASTVEQAKIHEKSKKGTVLGAKTGFGKPVPRDNTSPTVSFCRVPGNEEHHVIFKYRTRQALILAKILKDEKAGKGNQEAEDVKPLVESQKENERGEGSSNRAAKRKDETVNGSRKVIDLVDVEEQDVKPFKKQKMEGNYGKSKETAIDLT